MSTTTRLKCWLTKSNSALLGMMSMQIYPNKKWSFKKIHLEDKKTKTLFEFRILKMSSSMDMALIPKPCSQRKTRRILLTSTNEFFNSSLWNARTKSTSPLCQRLSWRRRRIVYKIQKSNQKIEMINCEEAITKLMSMSAKLKSCARNWSNQSDRMTNSCNRLNRMKLTSWRDRIKIQKRRHSRQLTLVEQLSRQNKLRWKLRKMSTI